MVLVGPNSSGKSQLLQDLYCRLSGEPRQLVVAVDIQIEKPPFEPFLKCLETEGYFSASEDESGRRHLHPLTMYSGTGKPVSKIDPKNALQWYGDFAPENPESARRRSEFLNHLGRLLVTVLFLDRRLTSMNETAVIDFQKQSPQHDLHALYLDDTAQARLNEEMVNSFRRAVWPDTSRGSVVTLKVSDESLLPTADARLSHKRMTAYRSIESEGDGLKSYVATCVALLLGKRPICLIDEPELCLHPPQAYNLGKFIGRFGASLDTVTLVATHSSHLLRGVLQTAPQVQIVRLTRSEKIFSAYLVPSADLTEALTRPTLRAESVLDGIFSQAVVVVEADGDRVVYQAVWETLAEEFTIDLHFSTVGGTGGIADTCGLYRTLNIPVAVVADLDMLVNGDCISRVLERLVSGSDLRQSLLKECREIAGLIRDLPPRVEAQELRDELIALSTHRMDWTSCDDLDIRRRLRHATAQLDRMRRLKRGGTHSYEGDLGKRLASLVVSLKSQGLFLVHVGELEEWLASYNVGVSKSDKRAWSNAAAHAVQKAGRQCGDVWDFVSGVGQYLSTTPLAASGSAAPSAGRQRS